MRPKPNRMISRAAMTLLMMVLTATTAWANDAVTYIDMNGDTQTVTEYTEVTSAMTADGSGNINWSSGTYVVKSDVTLSGSIRFLSDVIDLIVCDGKTLTVNGNSNSDGAFSGNTLNIYAQSNGTGMGAINANRHTSCSHLNIAGGTVTLDAGGDSYGLYIYSGSDSGLTVNGGDVTILNNDTYFGAFYFYGLGFFTLNGGKLTVTNSKGSSDKAIHGNARNTINFNGGTAEINGYIYNCQNINLNGGNVTVNGEIYNSARGYTVTYDFTSATDSYYIQSFSNNISSGETRTVKVADGKGMKDSSGNIYSCTLTNSKISAISGKTLTPATQTEYIQCCLGMGNDGSAEHPYTINDANGWNAFCLALDDNATWNHFSGKYVKLGANITVTQMAGGSNHAFTGTFDGNHKTLTLNYGTAQAPIDAEFVAPFVEVSGGAEFINLNIDGHIYAAYTGSSESGVGGLIGHLFGGITIEGCTSTVEINSTKDRVGGFVGLCEHAVTFTDCKSSAVVTCTGSSSGFVGWSRASEYTIAFYGCLFNGKVLKKNGVGSGNGGFVGWKGYHKTVEITNCLVDPAAVAEGETMADNNSATFCRYSADTSLDNQATSITNCYYTETFGNAQGTQAYSISGGDYVTVGNAGTATTYDVSGITSYGTGILYGGVLYAGNGDEVSLTLAHQDREGYDFIGYTVTAGNLNGSTLTMPNGNVTINAEYTYPPSELTATDITFTTATLNWNGLQESYNVRYHPAIVILNEGFESGTMPDGWTRTGSSQNVDYQWKITSGTGRDDHKGAATGNYNAGCYIDNYNDSDILITPVIDLGNVVSATLSFNFWNTVDYRDINILNVYYRVDEGEWQLLYTYEDSTEGWIPVTINLEGMAANYQIGFECESHWSCGMGIDDVKVIDNGEWTTVTNVSSPHDLTGLTPETPYVWQVQGSNCDGEGSTTEWSEAGTFTTLNPCETPYNLTATDITATTATLNWNGLQESYSVRYQPAILNEGFESGTMPDGWTRTGAYWQVTSGTGFNYTGAATGNYNAGCYIDNYNDSDILITPVMDLGNVASATLSFNFWNTVDYGDINILNVYYRVDGGEWQSLYTYSNATEGWIPVTINLEGMAANYQIGFECESHCSFGMGIDDVKVIDNGAWTTENNVLYPFTLTGLTPETPYVWQVQGLDCNGEGSTTEWSEMGIFTTNSVLELADNDAEKPDGEKNADLISGDDGNAKDVMLAGRTLFKDGDWNTLCLPFDVVVGSGQMEGATAMTMNAAQSGFDSASGLLTLYFDGVGEGSTIAAGTPFIVKWTGNAGQFVENPMFSGVTIDLDSPSGAGGAITFNGSYDVMTFDAADQNVVLLEEGSNTLKYAASGDYLGACRAYFVVDPTAVGEGQTGARLTDYILHLGSLGLLEGSFIQRGDANGDGNISVTDIAVVVNCILQLTNNGGFSEYGADANGDGQVTVTDIGVIVDKILGVNNSSAASRRLQQEVEPQ